MKRMILTLFIIMAFPLNACAIQETDLKHADNIKVRVMDSSKNDKIKKRKNVQIGNENNKEVNDDKNISRKMDNLPFYVKGLIGFLVIFGHVIIKDIIIYLNRKGFNPTQGNLGESNIIKTLTRPEPKKENIDRIVIIPPKPVEKSIPDIVDKPSDAKISSRFY